MNARRPSRIGRACASTFKATATPSRLAAALLCAAVVSSLVIAGSSASVTPTPRGAKAGTSAASLHPVPVGTKVHTVSAASATAQQRARRAMVRGGHAVTVKMKVTRLVNGFGTKAPGQLPQNHQEHIMLAPPAPPTITAGAGMPVFDVRPPLAAVAPLAPGNNRLSPVDMRVLVIAADGNETDLGHIKAALDNVGVPYTVMLARDTELTDALLWDGVGHGYYQGVIMTTNSLTYSPDGGTTWVSAFTDAEFQTLWAYESSFNVRQVTSYTAAFGWPETLGLSTPVATIDTTTTPLDTTLTPAGRTVFNYLNPTVSLRIGNAWVYESTITEPATTTALLTAPGGYPIASVHTSADGRENLAITAANGYYLRHSQVLAYGVVNWVTKGLYLGKKRIAIVPQVDDLFIDNDQWNVNTNTNSGVYRNTSADWQAIVNWQAQTRASSPLLSAIRLEWPFNGEGTTGIYRPDTLSAYVYTHQSTFSFVSHTWSHQNLDYANNESGPLTTAAVIRDELTRNDTFANQRRLTGYFKDSMVQPDISGLNTLPGGANNTLAQQTAYNWGIRNWISDTSRVGWNNPSPNTGFWAPGAPGLLVIPRRPTNIFYNVSTPAQVADEYNYFYAPGGLFPYWPSPRTYAQIIDIESDNVLAYVLQGDNDPLMFHISNVRAYDGSHSVMGDLLTSVFTKYRALYNIPIQGPNQHQLGLNMRQWMTYKSSGAQAVLNPCSSIQLTVTQAAAVPVTGVTYGTSGDTYNGQRTSNVTVNPGQTVTVPLPATPCV
jgi:hypothetical protein